MWSVRAAWYAGLHWEDVLVGILVRDYVGAPQPSAGYKVRLLEDPQVTCCQRSLKESHISKCPRSSFGFAFCKPDLSKINMYYYPAEYRSSVHVSN